MISRQNTGSWKTSVGKRMLNVRQTTVDVNDKVQLTLSEEKVNTVKFRK